MTGAEHEANEMSINLGFHDMGQHCECYNDLRKEINALRQENERYKEVLITIRNNNCFKEASLWAKQALEDYFPNVGEKAEEIPEENKK